MKLIKMILTDSETLRSNPSISVSSALSVFYKKYSISPPTRLAAMLTQKPFPASCGKDRKNAWTLYRNYVIM